MPQKTIDQCKALNKLVTWSKDRLQKVEGTNNMFEAYLNYLFLLKANKFLNDPWIEAYFLNSAELIIPTLTTRKDEEVICKLSQNALLGVSDEVAKKVGEFLSKTSSNGLRISNGYNLYELQFALLFWSQLGANKSFVENAENNLMRYLMVLPHAGTLDDPDDIGTGKKSSLLQTYAYATSILAAPHISTNELERLKATISTEDSFTLAYGIGNGLEYPASPRASSARAIPSYLALYTKYPTGSGDRKTYRETLLKALDNYVSPEVLPWLLLHSEGKNMGTSTNAHIGEDRLASYYLLPSLPYATSSVQLLKNDGISTPEEKAKLELIEAKLKNALANIYETVGFFTELGSFSLEDNPLIGLALLPLIKEKCSGGMPSTNKEVSSYGIVRENINDDKLREKRSIDIILEINADPQIPQERKYNAFKGIMNLARRDDWTSFTPEEKERFKRPLVGFLNQEVETAISKSRAAGFDDYFENRITFLRQAQDEYDYVLSEKQLGELEKEFKLALSESIEVLHSTNNPSARQVSVAMDSMYKYYEHLSEEQKKELIGNLKSIPGKLNRETWYAPDRFIFDKTKDKYSRKRLLMWCVRRLLNGDFQYHGPGGKSTEVQTLWKVIDSDNMYKIVDAIYRVKDEDLPSMILEGLPEGDDRVREKFKEKFPGLKEDSPYEFPVEK